MNLMEEHFHIGLKYKESCINYSICLNFQYFRTTDYYTILIFLQLNSRASRPRTHVARRVLYFHEKRETKKQLLRALSFYGLDLTV